MKKCTMSRSCRKHGHHQNTIYCNTGFNNGSIIKTNNIELDNNVKNILCMLINDRALMKMFDKYDIIIKNLTEINYNPSSKCLGMNVNCGYDIYIVFRMNGNILEYNQLISIIIHEIAHCWFPDHDEKFINIEKKLRNKWYKYAIQFNQISMFDKFIFCESLESSGSPVIIDMGIYNFKKYMFQYLLLLCMAIFFILYTIFYRKY